MILTVSAGWLAGAAGLLYWARIAGAEAARPRLGHAIAALFFALVTLLVVGFPIAIFLAYSCGEGEGIGQGGSLLRLLGLIVPALYYGIGYWGFRRPRRLLYAWPLAVGAGLIAFLALELVIKASSGCVDA